LPLLVNIKVSLYYIYADNTILFITIHSLSDCTSLQDDLNLLSQWNTQSDINFNPVKSKYMRITCLHCTYITTKWIPSPLSTKYLGITWDTHINNITSKGFTVKAFLQCNLKFCPSHFRLKWYKTMVRPTYNRMYQFSLVISHQEKYCTTWTSAKTDKCASFIYNQWFFLLQ